MKTWLRRIFVCVILGAITTVAVAGACACWSKFPLGGGSVQIYTAGELTNRTALYKREVFGATEYVCVRCEQSPIGPSAFRRTSDNALAQAVWLFLFDGPIDPEPTHQFESLVKLLPSRFVVPDLPEHDDQSGERYVVRLWDCRGWPVPALASVYEWNHNSSPYQSQLPGWLPVAAKTDPNRHITPFNLSEIVVPVVPMWYGFLVDSTFYATAWFSLLILPGMIRRVYRRSNQQCVMCGYALRGISSTRCPECGTATTVERS